MLKTMQFLGSSSGFVPHRLKPHSNYGFSLTSLSTKPSSSSSRRPIKKSFFLVPACSFQKGRDFRAFRASRILSVLNSDGTSPSSLSSTSVTFQSTNSIGKINFCQSCGGPTKHEIPDGEEKIRAICTLCGNISYENPKMVVGCLIEHDDKILLCKRKIQPSYGLWTLPAGYMEMGESAAEGAIRETWEEAGAEVQVLSPFAQLDIPRIGQVRLI